MKMAIWHITTHFVVEGHICWFLSMGNQKIGFEYFSCPRVFVVVVYFVVFVCLFVCFAAIPVKEG